MAAFLGFFLAQSAKVFTHYYTEQKWDLTRLVSSGGMPSSHTALVLGLTAALGVLQGTSSPAFAIALVFSLIVSAAVPVAAQRRGKMCGRMGRTAGVGLRRGTRPAAASTFPASLPSHACTPRLSHAPSVRGAHRAGDLAMHSGCMQVMYDASGVRLHAGKQASVLNMIITELPPDHPVSSSTGQLKDTLGHTPLQVRLGGAGPAVLLPRVRCSCAKAGTVPCRASF